MKHEFFQKFRFSEIRQDQWQASVGKLSGREKTSLKQRELVYLIYRTIRFVVLFPVSIIRFASSFFYVLVEFERLHFSPLRKIERGMDCVIDRQTWLVNGHNITMGDFVKISAFSSIMAGNISTIKIGTNTIIGPGVVIVSLNHGTKMNGVPIRYQEWKDLAADSIIIGDDVWIGANAVILPGTTISNGSVIGAGAVIKGTVPSDTITYYRNGQLTTVRRQ